MNKAALKKGVWKHYKIWPPAKRFVGGPGGIPLPPVDDDSLMTLATKDAIELNNPHTGHKLSLGYDHIREYLTDPVRERCGTLILKVQANIGGCYAWTEPLTNVSVPDQFKNVVGWKRENDAAYLSSLSPQIEPTPIVAPSSNGSPALGLVLVAAFCFGLAAIASA